MPLIYNLIIIALASSILTSIVINRANIIVLVNFIFAMIGALAFSLLTSGDAPFLLKYNFINTYSLAILGSGIFILLSLSLFNKFSHDLSRKISGRKLLILFIIFLIASVFLPWLLFKLKPVNNCANNGCPVENREEVKYNRTLKVDSFESCVEAGFAVMESYPRRCSSDEQTFTEHIGNILEKTDLIRLNSPRPNDKITSPLQISGEARGYWFFEGSFPVVLTNWDGLIIAEGFLSTPGEWMTEEFVPFSGELTFTVPDFNPRGTLILMKDNPSGLPEHDDALEIPVSFLLDN